MMSPLVGGVRKRVIFADVQYYLRKVGGSDKVQKCADVIQGWSLIEG